MESFRYSLIKINRTRVFLVLLYREIIWAFLLGSVHLAHEVNCSAFFIVVRCFFSNPYGR